MSRPSMPAAAVLAAALLLGLAAPAAAQPAPAAPRNGLEQNGLNYQPSQGGTVSREKAAGVRPSVQSQQQEDHELSDIDRKLLQSEGKNPANAVSPTPK